MHYASSRGIANVRDTRRNLALRIADEIRDHVGVEQGTHLQIDWVGNGVCNRWKILA